MVHVDSVEKGRVSLSLKEDLDVSGDDKSETKKQGNNRDNSNNDSSKNRKRVSFEDDFEKGL